MIEQGMIGLGMIEQGIIELGSDKWFEAEALKSIHKSCENEWDFADSALLYTDKGMRAYKAAQTDETAYSKDFTAVEHHLLKAISGSIAKNLPENFNYIDIGPGTERKEKYFFEAFRERGKSFSYFPIDINKRTAIDAAEFAQSQGINAIATQDRFENPLIMDFFPKDRYNFVSLGATFANYDAEEILVTLKRLTGKQGAVFITAQLRERIDIVQTANSYLSPGVVEMFKVKLGLIGLKEGDYGDFETDHKITVFTRVKTPSKEMSAIGMKAGDKIVVLKTYRYTIGKIREIIGSVFRQVEIFDDGLSFVGITLSE